MTRRERLEAKLEKREEWAAGRRRKSEAAFNGAHEAVRGIEPGQPILVGHHSEKRHRRALERHDSRMRAGIESHDMAEYHESKAEGLQRQLDKSIFSDDDNSVEALQARIEETETRAARIAEYNRSCRKAAKTAGKGDLSLLDEKQKRDLLATAKVCPYQIGPGGALPSYQLTNLRARIRTDRERLKAIVAKRGREES